MKKAKLDQRWTRAVAERHIASWRQSGLSQSAYGRKVGVSGARISRWHIVLAGESKPYSGENRHGFARVVVSDSSVAPGGPKRSGPEVAGQRSGLEIVLKSGRRVQVGDDFDVDTLRRVLKVLEC